MIHKVFIEHLPKWNEGANKGKINWRESVGCEVPFIYDFIEGILKIINYENNYLIIEYNSHKLKIKTNNFSRCKIKKIFKSEAQRRELINKSTNEYLFSIGEEIKNKNQGKIIILEHAKIGKKKSKGYKYKCAICENVDYISESNLKEKKGCNLCSGRKILKGYNDIWTTHPEKAKLLWDFEDGYKYSAGSSKKVDWKCPDCNLRIESKRINMVITQKLSCPRCSDGVSYPNKFMFNFLEQIEAEFEVEKIFEWLPNNKYDFYFSSLDLIVEIHGKQHYTGDFSSCGGRTISEEQENDQLKKESALINGIKKYIIIDARISDMEWIKKSIVVSELSTIFDLSNINWLKCHEFACGSFLKIACDLWNSGIDDIVLIGQQMKIHPNTVKNYLISGSRIGLCNYNKEYEKSKKNIIQLNLNDEFIQEYETAREASRKTGIGFTTISQVCNGIRKTTGGYKWMFKKDWIQL